MSRADKSLGNELARLLALKTTAAYETRAVSRADAKSAARMARRLVDAAADALTRS